MKVIETQTQIAESVRFLAHERFQQLQRQGTVKQQSTDADAFAQSEIVELDARMNELKSLSILSEQLDGWTITTFVLQFPLSDVKPPVSVLGFAAQVASNRVVFEIPYWFLVLFCAAITALVLFKLRPRFSIRLLLVAMTLFATVLGIAVARNNQ